MRGLFVIMALLIAGPASAQVQYRPTEPPIVSAENEQWFKQGEPMQIGGDVYYQAGARVFFNGNTMVRTGHYNGVPLYADTTIEPYSIVFVPIGRGIMQPYERPRRGDLAGTTGSRTPSFPVAGNTAGYRGEIMAPVSPTNLPQPLGAIGRFDDSAAPAAGAAGAQQPQGYVTALRPENNDGIWIMYQGNKFLSAGAAVPFRAADFQLVGDYSGFPVFTKKGSLDDVIYLPTRAGLVAPYRKK